MLRMLQSLRNRPPDELAGLPVTHIDDLLDESCWLGPIKGDTDRSARNFLHFPTRRPGSDCSTSQWNGTKGQDLCGGVFRSLSLRDDR